MGPGDGVCRRGLWYLGEWDREGDSTLGPISGGVGLLCSNPQTGPSGQYVSGHRGGKVRWGLEHFWSNIKDSKCHARGDNDPPGTPAERLLFRRMAHYQEMTSGYPGNRASGPRAGL